MKVTYEILKEMVMSQMPSSRSFLLESPVPEILDEVSILKNKHPFKAIFMFGPAGSGKGYILKNILKTPGDFKVSNPDERIEEVFPAFGISMKFANSAEGGDPELEKLQQKSRVILQQASRAHTANLISIANPLIFDTTGEDVEKMSKRIKSLVKLGYDVAVMMINVPTQASVERDTQRKRTVGKVRTTGISQTYQKNVVQQRGYYDALGKIPHVTMLADDVYNNIFNLSSGELLTKPTRITPEMLPDDLNPEKNPEAFQTEKTKIEKAVARLGQWLETPVENPGGEKLLRGMKALIKTSGGVLGQNINDLVIAMAKDSLKGDQSIVDAANHLSALGGGEQAVSGAIRGKKKADGSIRQAVKKDPDVMESLAEVIRDIMRSS